MGNNWLKLLMPIWNMFMSINDDQSGPDQISLNNQRLVREMENENKEFNYDVKCRKCGKITRMFSTITNKINFERWASDHSTFPIKKQCDCDRGMIMFHDIISFSIIF